MKNKNLKIFLTFACLVFLSTALNAQIARSYQGNWKLNAPSAPEEYMNGTCELKSDTVIISFPDVPYSFVSNWIKVRNDSLIFETYINNGTVDFSLKLEKDKIEGYAVWSEGETPITLTREAKKE